MKTLADTGAAAELDWNGMAVALGNDNI